MRKYVYCLLSLLPPLLPLLHLPRGGFVRLQSKQQKPREAAEAAEEAAEGLEEEEWLEKAEEWLEEAAELEEAKELEEAEELKKAEEEGEDAACRKPAAL